MVTLHLLVDADGNMLDWGGHWDLMRRSAKYAQYTNIPLTEEQRSFNLKLGLTEEEQAIVDEMFNDFKYGKLKPLPGAVEAFAKMNERGHHTQFATSPWWSNRSCLQGKSDSILKHFGEDAQKKTILASDKTILRGDYLFDDKPKIEGFYIPTWMQIVYDQPYNQETEGPRLFHWDDWEEVLDQAQQSKYVDAMYLVN